MVRVTEVLLELGKIFLYGYLFAPHRVGVLEIFGVGDDLGGDVDDALFQHVIFSSLVVGMDIFGLRCQFDKR